MRRFVQPCLVAFLITSLIALPLLALPVPPAHNYHRKSCES